MRLVAALERLLAQAGGGRLALRFVMLSLVLLLVVQAAGFGVVRGYISAAVDRQVDAELDVGENVWRRLLENRAGQLALATQVLAADYGFRKAVATEDVDTIASVLENHGERIGATVALLVDNQFEVRASHVLAGRPLPAKALHDIAEAIAQSSGKLGLALADSQVLQFVAVRLRTPTPIGWVLMGFPVGQAQLDDMRSLSGLDVALLIHDAAGDRAGVAASTLPAATVASLATAFDGKAVHMDALDDRQARPLDLAAAGGHVQAVLLRSVSDVAAPMRQLQWVLLLITAVGIALFALGTAWNARRVTAPLRALVSASEAVGRGDYAQPVQQPTRRDEIGDLAQAFDAMRINLAGHAAELRHLAYVDRLTQLPNRAGFAEAVRLAMATAHPEHDRLAVLMLDLDRFKHVNDVLGYALGDRLLQAVARRLVDEVARPGDVVSRLGGDEFAILLPGADLDAARGAAARVTRALDRPLVLEDQTVDLGAGVGIARWRDDAADVDTLLVRAEVAMYGAKHAREDVRVYDPAHDSSSAQTLSLLSQLRHAIDAGELRLYLQPKVALVSRQLVGAETLVRWQHPQRGLVPPLDFIPFAEQTGFVRHLTLWVFEEAARQWRALAAETPLRLSVNLSTRDLMDVELPSRFDAILQRHDVPESAFCLEITESAIMDDPERALTTLNALAERGFKLSIDDFGTGYSSLAYLRRLPVNELKIDRSFVQGLNANAGDAKIVRSTIDLAHNLGLSVVAEGIEDAALMHSLAVMGCDEGQGYHLSRPLPLADFRHWAARWVADHVAAGEAAAA
ncbi:MAG: EAL domain-containing protein [Burkholderiaceae bacterium]|nr:EAL domain-containing protein [Rhodoferax sp.]MCP5286008.1 EAL domain-containing protein [Burkholderiaceae bacterium]